MQINGIEIILKVVKSVKKESSRLDFVLKRGEKYDQPVQNLSQEPHFKKN